MSLIIQENISLKKHNTFSLNVIASQFVEINNKRDFKNLFLHRNLLYEKLLFLGSGSNLLFTGDYLGCVVKINKKGIEILETKNDKVLVKAAAGVNWDEFVAYCVNKNLCGLENLSLIPGTVGASVVQNIGAYGTEVVECVDEVEVFDLETGNFKLLKIEDCNLGYRNSNFKSVWKDRYIVSSVIFKLNKNFIPILGYSALANELKTRNLINPSMSDIRNLIIEIRTQKIPNLETLPNAGSFFKNPSISFEKLKQLQKKFPNIAKFPLNDSMFKIASAWLIENCGLKGYRYKNVGIYQEHSLFIVNYGAATPLEIVELSEIVQKKVYETFQIEIEPEVVFI